MSTRHLDSLLHPRSVAVVGASDRPGRLGTTVWRNLRDGGFEGPLHAVNLRGGSLDGQPVHASVEDLPEAPELALLCTPPHSIAGLVEALGRRGTRAAVVLTRGLDEAQRHATLAAARPHVLRLLGPGSLGLVTPGRRLNASAAPIEALAGELAFVSQSNALLTWLLDWARPRRIGFSQLVALGERADVDAGDLLDQLGSDAATRAILLYIEAVESPRKFMSAARAAARNKPVIVVKAGRAEPGACASRAGTADGADAVFDAAFRRAGMLRVDTLQDLLLAAETLARFRDHRGERLTVMANGGGPGVMAADAAARAGITLGMPAPPSLPRFGERRPPPAGPAARFVDLLDDAPVERYVRTLQALLAEPGSGAVLFMHAPTAGIDSADVARACVRAAAAARERVMACWLGDATVADARRLFVSAGIADYATPEEAVRAFAMLQTYRRNQEQLMEAPSAAPERPAPRVDAARALLARVLDEGREALRGDEVRELLGAYGLPRLQRTVPRPQAQELFVGADIDAAFGPVVRFGQGGTAVDPLEDRAVALPPLNAVLARELVSRTRISRLLAGYADRPPVRMEGVTDVLMAVSCMLADLPELAELELNPLLADPAGALVLDARVRVSARRPAGTGHFAIRPYPVEWVETLDWRGDTLTVRPIRPEDEPQHRAFLERLDAEDVRMRVFHTVRYLPRSELARLTQIDYSREMAFVAERRGPDGRPETVGWCASSPTRTRSRRSSGSSCARTSRGRAWAGCCWSASSATRARRGCGGWSRSCCGRTMPCSRWRVARDSSSTRRRRPIGTRCSWCCGSRLEPLHAGGARRARSPPPSARRQGGFASCAQSGGSTRSRPWTGLPRRRASCAGRVDAPCSSRTTTPRSACSATPRSTRSSARTASWRASTTPT